MNGSLQICRDLKRIGLLGAADGILDRVDIDHADYAHSADLKPVARNVPALYLRSDAAFEYALDVGTVIGQSEVGIDSLLGAAAVNSSRRADTVGLDCVIHKTAPLRFVLLRNCMPLTLLLLLSEVRSNTLQDKLPILFHI